MTMEPIKIQDWSVPRIGPSTHRQVHRGYVEFFAKRGLDVSQTFRDSVTGAARVGKRVKAKREAKQLAEQMEEEGEE
jgi:hypothetical protein